MTEEDEISKLQALYAEYFDARDAERFADLFVPEGIMVPPGFEGKELKGREILQKVVRNTPPGGSHQPAIGEIRIDGEHATATSSYKAVMPDGSVRRGSYEDAFAKVDGVWKFTRREVKPID